MKKFCTSLREYAKKYKLFRKEENDTVNKSMQKYVIFVEKIPRKSLLKIRSMEKSEIIVILQVNTEAQHIVLVI